MVGTTIWKVNFNGAYLYVNPKGESRYWTMAQVTEQGVSSETTQLGDIDGDGKPELLGSVGSAASRVVGYWKPGADATARWTWVPVSDKGDWGGHAYGLGDLNGDGKVDIVQGSGWWAQPAAGAASGPWAFTAVPLAAARMRSFAARTCSSTTSTATSCRTSSRASSRTVRAWSGSNSRRPPAPSRGRCT